MQIILSLLLSGIAVFVSAYVIPGVEVDSFVTALIAGLILGIVNTFVKPVISLLTLPLNFLTLGLFSLVISALMVMLTSYLVTGFRVDGFVSALLFGIVVSLVNGFLFALNPAKK